MPDVAAAGAGAPAAASASAVSAAALALPKDTGVRRDRRRPVELAGRDAQDERAAARRPARVTVTGPCWAARPTILRLIRLRAAVRLRLDAALALAVFEVSGLP